jgi:hypothetical protein
MYRHMEHVPDIGQDADVWLVGQQTHAFANAAVWCVVMVVTR